jgi:hypothetical protein
LFRTDRRLEIHYAVCRVNTGFLYSSLSLQVQAAYRVLVKKIKGRRPLGRPRRRWEYNIKRYLTEVGWGHGLHRSVSG